MQLVSYRPNQIIQKKIDEIEILLVIGGGLRDVGSSVDEIAKNIKNYIKRRRGRESPLR